MTSPDLTAANIEKIAELFPSVVTESIDADGNPVKAIDFDLLRQELSDHVVEGPQERYQLDWPGKREALLRRQRAHRQDPAAGARGVGRLRHHQEPLHRG